MNTISVVIAVLDSHEILRRQLIHMATLDVEEIIIVDDGSRPPLAQAMAMITVPNLRIIATNNFNPWTQPQARNLGVREAKSEYVLCTDIDHILTRDLVEFVRRTDADVVRFRRCAAVLDAQGQFDDRMDTLKKWGYIRRHKRVGPHGNSYAMKRSVFLELGGSIGNNFYPNRDEVEMKRKLHDRPDLKVIREDPKPTIYVMPNGRFCSETDADFNPFGLFHNLSRGPKPRLDKHA